MAPYLGTATSRVDGPAKVTGKAKYAAEFNAEDLAYASIVSSTIAKGRILNIDAGAALGTGGVIAVLTHQNRPRMAGTDQAYTDEASPGGASDKPFRPLYDANIAFSGQPVAVVVADTSEVARHAASLVRIEYAPDAYVTDLERERNNTFALGADTFALSPSKPRGDVAKASARAAVRHDAEYFVPVEYHNPMEMFATTVIWEGGGRITVYDKTQGVQNVERYLCSVLGMKSEDVRVMSEFMGGGFGIALRPQYNVLLAVLAAQALQRSVRVVLTRPQM